MTRESKFFIGVGLVTLLIIVGAAIMLSGTPQTPQAEKPVDQAVLVKKTSHATNPKGAKVTIVEFGDFQCPACGSAYPVTKKIISDYKDKINFVFRNFPLDLPHKNARISAEAAEAAGTQGKYWEMHDILYERQNEWGEASDPMPMFMDYAKELKLDANKFKAEVEKKTHADLVQADYDDGIRLGVNATPTFYINGIKQEGSMTESEFKSRIDPLLK